MIKHKRQSAVTDASPKRGLFYSPPKPELDQVMDLYDPPMPNPAYPNVE